MDGRKKVCGLRVELLGNKPIIGGNNVLTGVTYAPVFFRPTKRGFLMQSIR